MVSYRAASRDINGSQTGHALHSSIRVLFSIKKNKSKLKRGENMVAFLLPCYFLFAIFFFLELRSSKAAELSILLQSTCSALLRPRVSLPPPLLILAHLFHHYFFSFIPPFPPPSVTILSFCFTCMFCCFGDLHRRPLPWQHKSLASPTNFPPRLPLFIPSDHKVWGQSDGKVTLFIYR